MLQAVKDTKAWRKLAGVDGLHIAVLDGNAPMLKVFEKSGLPMSTRREQGVVHVALRLH